MSRDDRYFVSYFEILEFHDFFRKSFFCLHDNIADGRLILWSLDPLDLVDLLDATLDARWLARSIAKSIDPCFLFFYVFLLELMSFELTIIASLFFHEIILISTWIIIEFFSWDFDDFFSGIVYESHIMRDWEHCLFPDFAKFFEKNNSFDIKMVGRLIENEKIDFCDHEFRDLYFCLFSSWESEDIEIELLIGKSEIFQNLCLKIVSSVSIIFSKIAIDRVNLFPMRIIRLDLGEPLYFLGNFWKYHEHLFLESICRISARKDPAKDIRSWVMMLSR